MFIFGGLSTIIAGILEYICLDFLDDYFYTDTIAYIAIEAFLIVGLAEEFGKYFIVKKVAWKHPAFNTTFDAVVYAIFSSLGFATVENILYLCDGSYSTALWRGILSVPGHAIFAVFMGNYLGVAKRCEVLGDENGKKANLRKALFMAVLTHGFYDFCILEATALSLLAFLIYEIFIVTYTIKKVKKLSNEDALLFPGGYYPGHYAAQQLYMQGAIPGYQHAGYTPMQAGTYNFDPNTGRPIGQQRTTYNFDPNTGRPIGQQRTTYNFDPNTGRPIGQPRTTYNFDPNTGKPYAQQSSSLNFDPETGRPIIKPDNFHY